MRVFLSHALDKRDDEQVAFLDALDAALQQPTPAGHRHAVFVDRRSIVASRPWESVLLDALEECDTALLLLTPRSLEPERVWVLREATLLASRAARHAGFRLYALARGVERAQIESVPLLRSLKLERLQFVAAGAAAAEVAALVHADLDAAPAAGDSPLDRLTHAMAAHLRQADADQLRALCDRIDAPLAFDAGHDALRRCAHAIARAVVGGRLQAVGGLAGLLDRLDSECAMPPEAQARLRELAAPLWVAPDDAEALARCRAAAAAGGPPHAAALFAQHWAYSTRMLVHRGLLPALPRLPVVVPLLNVQAGSGADEIEAELLAEYGRTRGNLGAAAARQVLQQQLQQQPVYAVVPPPIPPAADLCTLHGRYARLVVVAAAGDATADELDDGVRPLPALDPAAETAHFADYVNAGGSA
jgi:hypothetical protein